MKIERDNFTSRRQERLADEYARKAATLKALAAQISEEAETLRISLLLAEAGEYSDMEQRLRSDAALKRSR